MQTYAEIEEGFEEAVTEMEERLEAVFFRKKKLPLKIFGTCMEAPIFSVALILFSILILGSYTDVGIFLLMVIFNMLHVA